MARARGTRRPAARRGAWAAADQMISSLTNFALSAIVARAVGVREFGAFGVAFAAYVLITGLGGALASEPLLVRHTDSGGDRSRSVASASVGTAISFGILGGLACVVSGWLLPGVLGHSLLALGLVLPGLSAQDAWRYVFLAQGRPAKATANDAIWAAAQVVLMALVLASEPDPPVSRMILAWGMAAAVAAIAGAFQSGVAPRPWLVRGWLRSHADLWPRFAGEFAARQAGRQLALYAVGISGGLTALGAIRGAQVAFGPLNVVMLAVNLYAIPEAVRIGRRSLAAMGRTVDVLAVVLVGISLICGIMALWIPSSLGTALLGATWPVARPVLLPQAIVVATFGAASSYLAGLRAIAAAGRSFRVRMATVPLVVAGGAMGAVLGDAGGALLGVALAQGAGTLLFRAQLVAAIRQAPGDRLDDLTAPEDGPDRPGATPSPLRLDQ